MATAIEPTTETFDSTGVSPIARVRGKNYPDLDAEAKRKVDFINQLWGEGESDALHRYKQGTHHILYADGRQHISWETLRKSWEDLPNSQNEVRVTVNYIKPVLRARRQRLLGGEIHWRAIPRSNSYEHKDEADVAVRFIRARWKQLDMDHKVAGGLMQAFCTGACALKSFWNPDIGEMKPATIMLPAEGVDPMSGAPTVEMQEFPVGEDGQPVEDEKQAFRYRPGDTDTSVRTIFNLRTNPEAHGWTVAEGLRWLIDTDVVPLAVAKEKYPEIADEIRATEQGESALTYERIAMGSTIKKTAGVYAMNPHTSAAKNGQQANEMATIREYWEMPSQFFPNGRLIVSAGGTLAYDGEFPHGIFPYAPLFDEPGLMTPWGRASVGDMVDPQNVINREWTSIVQEMSVSGVGQFVSWQVPGVPTQITSEPRAVIQIPVRNAVGNRSIKDVFARLDPAQIAPDRWRMIEQAKMSIFDVGAFHEVSRGQIPPGLDSGVAIEHLLEQEAGQLKVAVDSLKRTLILWARHQLGLASWGYGAEEERWLPVQRPDLGYMIERVTGAQLPDPETIGLDIEYFRPQSEAAMRAEVKELMGLGFIDPRRGLKLLDMGMGIDAAFDSQTRHYARARKENLDFEAGNYVEVPGMPTVDPMSGAVMPGQPQCMHIDPQTGQLYPFHLPGHDDDLIHIEVHNEIALDESKPWPVRLKTLLHIEEHQATMMAQQMAAQEAAAGPDNGPPGGDSPDAQQ